MLLISSVTLLLGYFVVFIWFPAFSVPLVYQDQGDVSKRGLIEATESEEK